MLIQKIIGAFIVALLLSVLLLSEQYTGIIDDKTTTSIANNESNNYRKLNQLIATKQSGKIITIKAVVIKILDDDLNGDKHQKLILKLFNSNVTLLLAHNIDMAPRVPVKKGAIITVHGQYEWNEKGGLIHWTHRDIKNKHPDGWVEYKDKRYH